MWGLGASPWRLLVGVIALAGTSLGGLATHQASAMACQELTHQQTMRLRGGAPGRKLTPQQQAAVIPMEALRFSASVSDGKLTGGAGPAPKTTVSNIPTLFPGGKSGLAVASEPPSEMPVTYDPRVMHKFTEPWSRANVNDQAFGT